MSNQEPKKWYTRTHDFAPYTRADGIAVSEEFDAIQQSFEVIPQMRTDGKGFAVSPVIPEPTQDNHPATYGQLKNGTNSVMQMKASVEETAQQVAQHNQTTATNTRTATQKASEASQSATTATQQAQLARQQADTATQKATEATNQANIATEKATIATRQAESATSSASNANQSETLARKWAVNPEDNVVQSGQFSAYHHAQKARKQAQLAESAKSRAVQAETSAQQSESVATQKASEVATLLSSAQQAQADAAQSAQQAEQSKQNIRNVESTVEQLKQQAEQAKDQAESFKADAENAKTIAEQKANEATSAASRVNQVASGRKEWREIDNVPTASTNQAGIVQLSNDADEDETKAATSKALKIVKDNLTQQIQNATIPDASIERAGKVQLSNATDSDSETTAATSKAVKSAYDKGIEAFNLANSKQSPATTLAGYGITNFKVESAQGNLNDFRTPGLYSFNSLSNSQNRPGSGFTGNLQVISGGQGNERWCHQLFYRHYSDEVYERHQTSGSNDNWSPWKKQGSDGVPVGSIVAFPKEITNPQGFLRCDGTTFAQNTYPDLYRVLGNKNRLPNLTRSDVGMLAYFPQDNIPNGWLACNGGTISSADYPELHRYLNNKYGTNKLPDAEDRFIRNAGNGLRVGDKQSDELKSHTHMTPLGGVQHWAGYYGFATNQSQGRVHDINDYEDSTRRELTSSTGGSETRPKSIIFKLCIKAKNSLDDVQFWIKAFGEVQNAGALDAGRLAQDIQSIRGEINGKANTNHTHTTSQISDFAQGVARTFTQNMGENGWTKLPNGLIIQWGVKNHSYYPGERQESNTFPLAFPNKCLSVYSTVLARSSGQGDVTINVISETTTGFTVSLELLGGSIGHYRGYNWFAIGH